MKVINLSAVSAMVACAACSQALASVTVFDSRAGFQGALIRHVTETFNGVATDTPFRNSVVAMGEFTLQGFGPNQQDFNSIDIPPLSVAGFDIDGTAVVIGVTYVDSGFKLSFKAPITAWGADFFGLQAPGGDLRTAIDIGSTEIIPPLRTHSVSTFLGVKSSYPFTEIVFRGVNPDLIDVFAMDNVTFSSPVPEPSSTKLLFFGFAALAMRAKSFRRQR